MRLFFAVSPPPGLARTVFDRVGPAAGVPGLSPVPPGRLHYTLRFFAALDARRLPLLVEGAAGAAADTAAFRLEIARSGVFPEGAPRPRVLWLGAGAGSRELAALAARLDAALVRRGFPAAGNPFVPHLTVARLRAGFPRGAAEAVIDRLDCSHGGFTVAQFRLVHSVLTPSGPVYRAMETFPLVRRSGNLV